MAESDDDIGDVVDAIERGNTIRSLVALSQIQQARQAAEMRSKAQQAEAARAEQIYLGAHCPWCHMSLTGTPAVCAACTRDIAWLRLPLDAAVFKLISSNLHTFKEVYRDLLGASVVFDQNQKLVHVPLSSQQETGKTKETLRTLDEKLVAYINFFYRVVEQREEVIAKCPMCKSKVFASVLVSSKERTAQICPVCVVEAPNASIPTPIKHGCLGVIVLWLGLSVAWNLFTGWGLIGEDTGRFIALSIFFVVSIPWLYFSFRSRSKFNDRKEKADRQRQELQSAAAIPTGFLSFDAKTMSVLSNLLDLRTKQLEDLLKRFDGAELPKLIASESSDARSEFANQFEPVAQDSVSPILLPSQTPLRHIAASRFALAAAETEFTAIEKQKPLTADSPMIRAVALAMVAMKTVDVATVRACTDRLARKLIEITPEALLKSVQIVGREVQEAKLRYAFEQVCDSLRAEPESVKARHRVVAEVISELLPKDTGETTKNANGPKVIRALCKVLNS